MISLFRDLGLTPQLTSDEQTLYDNMKMLEQLDKKMNIINTNIEIVKIIFHDLYNEIICQKTI